jgi:hypothetical protein
MFKMMDGAINGTNKASLSGPGFLRVTDEPHQLFYDPFDGSTVDVTNRWSAISSLGAALPPSQTGGQLSVDAGALRAAGPHWPRRIHLCQPSRRGSGLALPST